LRKDIHCHTMIQYDKEILKAVKKGKIPESVFIQVHHCFQAIESVKDITIFDIKQIKGEYKNTYYRLRKGQYRAIFFFESKDIRVVALEHRSEVYKKWQ
jgi:mRNA interferase RelE/StbE